ncbi:hypothetical protein [Nocardiopsis suaedae]|uniref:Uncharacterized protein n=1 Tax=Nocardiopsis suaedae TaxID=3018444 RepID=A0ABT4TSA5_9ACTN|nr:hypothetical protein [Nocardiopsis suaedae]MDA2807579.1 hypothetical protein [Nocardiopsis suaedae]
MGENDEPRPRRRRWRLWRRKETAEEAGAEPQPQERPPSRYPPPDGGPPVGSPPDGGPPQQGLPGHALSVLWFHCEAHGEELAVDYFDPRDPPRCSHGDPMARKPE